MGNGEKTELQDENRDNSLFNVLGFTIIPELNAHIFNSHCTYAVRQEDRRQKLNRRLQNIILNYINKVDTKPYFL
jgi:hypothetical protein